MLVGSKALFSAVLAVLPVLYPIVDLEFAIADVARIVDGTADAVAPSRIAGRREPRPKGRGFLSGAPEDVERVYPNVEDDVLSGREEVALDVGSILLKADAARRDAIVLAG